MDDCFLHIFLCTLYKIMSAPVKVMILMSAKNGIQEDGKNHGSFRNSDIHNSNRATREMVSFMALETPITSLYHKNEHCMLRITEFPNSPCIYYCHTKTGVVNGTNQVHFSSSPMHKP